MKFVRWIISLDLALGMVVAQTWPARLEFEVVSLKPAEGLIAGQSASGGARLDGAQIHLGRYPLKSLIAMAYDIKPYQVIGPDWLESRFDIDAKLPAGTNRSHVPEMAQSLLADRFQMKFHNQSKDFPVYALLAMDGAGRLKDLTGPGNAPDPKEPVEATGYGGPNGMGANFGNGSSYSLADNKFEGKKVSMARLAGILSLWLDRPVIDMTELTGVYDFSIPVPVEDFRGMISRAFLNGGGVLPPQVLRQLDDLDNASLYAGLHSMGLKLEQRKAPLPVLVIDSILKSPTEN